jgi:hypothetical protein
VVEEGGASAGLFAGPRPQVIGQLGEISNIFGYF